VSSRNLDDLHPVMRTKAKILLLSCSVEWNAIGVKAIPTCTYRSPVEQDFLYSLGRTRRSHVGPWTSARPLGQVVTYAKGWQSSHNYEVRGFPAALAIDIAISVHGKLIWDLRSPYWQRAGQLGQGLGLVWYGAPNAPFREGPHFEHPMWKDVRSGTLFP
jgi:peptidoglycan L-alanyl-D-glutamate endopeptidase CwlK